MQDQGRRELTYEPDDGYRAGAPLDLDRVADSLGGRRCPTRFGECLVIDRRYEADRWHGDIRIGDCDVDDMDALALLDPAMPAAVEARSGGSRLTAEPRGRLHRPRDDRL